MCNCLFRNDSLENPSPFSLVHFSFWLVGWTERGASHHLTGELILVHQRDKQEEMKQVATTWTGRNEASISVHPRPEVRKHVRKRAEAEAELEKRERQTEQGSSWSHYSSASLSSLSSLCHMSTGSRVHSHLRDVSKYGCDIKAALSLPLAPMPSFGVPTAFPVLSARSPKFPRVHFFFSFLLYHFKQKSWCLVLNISISVYMFIFTVGKRWPLQQNLVFYFLCNCPWKSSIPMWVKGSQLSIVLCHNKIYTYLGHKL